MENNNNQKHNETKAELLRKKALEFLRKKGYYVVMLLCLGVLGTAAVLSLLPAEGTEKSSPTPTPQSAAAGTSNDERLADKTAAPTVSPAESPTPTPTLIPDFTPAPATEKPTAEKLPAPVEGKVLWKFAMDSLLYSKTLDQWTTHSGIDIGCRKGAEVSSILAGTVEEVYEDERLGVTVVLSHSEKRRTVYANLAADPPVKVGEKVKVGDTIGYVGDTSVTECGEDPHLHFEFILDNRFVNPADYILIGAE